MQFVELNKKVKRTNTVKLKANLVLIFKIREKINARHWPLLADVTRQCSRRRHTSRLQFKRQFAAFFRGEKGGNF